MNTKNKGAPEGPTAGRIGNDFSPAQIMSPLRTRRQPAMMKLSFEETLIEVWRQALVGNAAAVKLGKEAHPVRRTPKRGLRQVDFTFDEREIRGLEQNPETNSRWAQLARSGKKVMQFLSEGRYVANVVEGKMTRYGRTR